MASPTDIELADHQQQDNAISSASYLDKMDELERVKQLLERNDALLDDLRGKYEGYTLLRVSFELKELSERSLPVLIADIQAKIENIYPNINFDAVIQACAFYDPLTDQGGLSSQLKDLLTLEEIRLALLDQERHPLSVKQARAYYDQMNTIQDNMREDFLRRNTRPATVLESTQPEAEPDIRERFRLENRLDNLVDFFKKKDHILFRYRLANDDVHAMVQIMDGLSGFVTQLGNMHPVENLQNGRKYDIAAKLVQALTLYAKKSKDYVERKEHMLTRGTGYPDILFAEDAELSEATITQEVIMQMLAELPIGFLKGLKMIRVKNSIDAETRALTTHDLEEIGGIYLAQDRTIEIYTNRIQGYGNEGMREKVKRILFHEMGHHVHSNILSLEMLSQWDALIQRETNFVSPFIAFCKLKGDANTAAFEDFCETFFMYHCEPAMLEAIAPERYLFMQKLHEQYYPQDALDRHTMQQMKLRAGVGVSAEQLRAMHTKVIETYIKSIQ